MFSAEDAEAKAKGGAKVILVRTETSPEDIVGMNASEGILTAKGGMTSHAAVVARGMGKCCVAGCGQLAIDYGRGTRRVGEIVVNVGDWITLNGSTGEVMLGQAATVMPELGGAFSELMKWTDKIRQLGSVRMPTRRRTRKSPARLALKASASAARSTCFRAGRILAVRQMILASNVADREDALGKLVPCSAATSRESFGRWTACRSR